MNEDFMHKGHLCIVFELLSNSLLDLINLTLDPNVSHNGPGITLTEMRRRESVCDYTSKVRVEIFIFDSHSNYLSLCLPPTKLTHFTRQVFRFEWYTNLHINSYVH